MNKLIDIIAVAAEAIKIRGRLDFRDKEDFS